MKVFSAAFFISMVLSIEIAHAIPTRFEETAQHRLASASLAMHNSLESKDLYSHPPDGLLNFDALQDEEQVLLAKKKKRRGKKKKRKSKKKGSKAEKVSPILYLLPLGVGQFANGNAIMGSVFAAAEASGMIFAFLQFQNSSSSVAETNKYIDERNAEFAKIPGTNIDEITAHTDETVAEVAKRDAEAEAYTSSANLGWAIFGLAYAGSIVEAFVSGPSGASKNKKSRKKRKKKRKRGMLDLPNQNMMIENDLDLEEVARPIKPLMAWKLEPSFRPGYKSPLSPDLVLRWKLRF